MVMLISISYSPLPFVHHGLAVRDSSSQAERSHPGAPESAEVFEPLTEGLTLTGPLLSARAGHTATRLVNGSVLVAGGNDDVTPTADIRTLASARIGQMLLPL